MPSASQWRATAPYSPIGETDRAYDAWARIQRKPSSITLVRDGVAQAVQTARVEHDSGTTQADAELSKSTLQRLVVYGVRNHPTVATLNILEGDRFILNNRQYEVMAVMVVPGEIQAMCEVVS